MGALAIFQIIMMVIAVAMMFIGSKVKDDRSPAGLEDSTFPTAAESQFKFFTALGNLVARTSCGMAICAPTK